MLYCQTQPSIEQSNKLTFIGYDFPYQKLTNQLNRLRFSICHNQWHKIHDFTPEDDGDPQSASNFTCLNKYTMNVEYESIINRKFNFICSNFISNNSELASELKSPDTNEMYIPNILGITFQHLCESSLLHKTEENSDTDLICALSLIISSQKNKATEFLQTITNNVKSSHIQLLKSNVVYFDDPLYHNVIQSEIKPQIQLKDDEFVFCFLLAMNKSCVDNVANVKISRAIHTMILDDKIVTSMETKLF